MSEQTLYHNKHDVFYTCLLKECHYISKTYITNTWYALSSHKCTLLFPFRAEELARATYCEGLVWKKRGLDRARAAH